MMALVKPALCIGLLATLNCLKSTYYSMVVSKASKMNVCKARPNIRPTGIVEAVFETRPKVAWE